MNKGAVKGRILVVDDEAAMRELLTEYLSFMGFECLECSSGEEALILLKNQAFDALISDLRMPGISGLTLLGEVQNNYPHLACLMATADSEIKNGIDAMKLGADDYLVKPLNLEAVLRSLHVAMERKRMVVEMESQRRKLAEKVAQRTMQLRRVLNRVERHYDATLEALGAALDLRDSETEEHSRRVSMYCFEIFQRMGCSGAELRQLVRGSYLHDIGKIGIPDSILLKPGKLTAEETKVMQTHARIGYNLVCRIAFLAPAVVIVLTHQERYDGTGYPQGLAGEEIPLGARVFAVADSLDAMTSDRSYQRNYSFSEARPKIASEAGRQFDPKVVKVFLSIPEQVWRDIRLQVAGMPLLPSPVSFEALAV